MDEKGEYSQQQCDILALWQMVTRLSAIESLWYTTETNTILYANCTLLKKEAVMAEISLSVSAHLRAQGRDAI